MQKHSKLLTTLVFSGTVLTLFSVAHAQDRLSRAQEYENEMRWEAAISEYTEILKRDPTNVTARYRLGVVQEKVGAIDTALQSYQEALRLAPGHAEARQALAGYYVNQGIAFRRDHHSDAAINAFRHALRFNPDSATAHFELGQELAQRGQATEAIHAYQAAVKLDPNKSAAHARLAAVYAGQGQHENAVKAYQEVIRLNERDPAAHHGLGVAYSALGQRDQAIASLQQAVRFYLLLGQRDKARPAYELQKKLMVEKAAASAPQDRK